MDLSEAFAGGADIADEIGLLSRHLRAYATASEALEAWCEPRAIGEGPIRAEVAGSAVSSSGRRAIGYRRVRLLRGAAFLSTAEIRYRCEALSPAMILTLEETDVPFGVVVAPLRPHRVTTLARIAGDRPTQIVLIHHATVVDRCGRPIARVREAYRDSLIA
ncbi:MAG: hypothetical protein KJ587_13365 [Alphaproteobacteria bacterium]|nr:hypothetical protein [Alphaproteobacteria bacterium]